ncbi:MAG: hypothetical protein AAF591_14035 [Verrucomicrobiota bacterium]
MATIGTILLFVGAIISLVYAIFILVNAFKKSILWGLGSLFVPFVGLIFVIMHWDQNKQPFIRYLIGVAISIVGAVLGGAGAASQLPEP